MKLIKISTILLIVTGLLSCASNQNMRDISKYKVPVNDFSKTVELLISNQQFLEDEIMKINSQNPSVQRILLAADSDLKQENYIKTNSELERAFRITKNDGALYLRLAHLRYKQGLLKESESFASKGLMLTNISSWELSLIHISEPTRPY